MGTKFYRQDYTPTEESLERSISTKKSNQKAFSHLEPSTKTTEKRDEPSEEDLGGIGTGTIDFFSKSSTQEKTEVAKKVTFEEYLEAVESSTTKAQAYTQEEWDNMPAEEQKGIMDNIKECNG